MRSSQLRTPVHAIRATAAAATTVALAAGAHVFGGGTLPVAPVLLAIVALAGLGVTLATRFRLSFPVTAVLLGAGQLALHEAFTAFGQVPVSEAIPDGGASFGAVGHHAAPALLVHTLDAGAAHLHGLGSPPSLMMLAGHVAATVATALLLARGEDALWQLAAWLRPLACLPRLISTPVAAPAPARAPERFIPQPWRNLRLDSRRGPPAVVVLP